MPAFPGGFSNTFAPQIEASEELRIRYFREPDQFPLVQWAKFIPAKKTYGFYPVITTEMAGRIAAGIEEFDWPDGGDAPSLKGNEESFDLKAFRTRRQMTGYRLPGLAVAQSGWDMVADHSAIHMQRIMTVRAKRAIDQVTTAAAWGTNTATVPSIAGAGKTWVNSNSTDLNIKKSINAAILNIMRFTLGAAGVNDLRLVMGPDLAEALSRSPEIIDLIKQSPTGIQYVEGKGDFGTGAARFSLPLYLYGVRLVVDNTAMVTTPKGATQNYAFCWPTDRAALVTRKGDSLETNKDGSERLQGDAPEDGIIRFDTLQVFEYRGRDTDGNTEGGGATMSIEARFDDINKRNEGRVIDNCVPVLAAPASGFLFTGCQ
jgi:hypothetical protein